MRIIDTLRRSGRALVPDKTVREAAEVTEHAGVGALTVVDCDRSVGVLFSHNDSSLPQEI